MATFTGVFASGDVDVKIKVSGAFVEIAEMESYKLSFDGNVESWTPYGSDGWTKKMLTVKSGSLEASGKRSIGDTGNDYIAEMALKTGRDCDAEMELTFPDGATLTADVIINVTSAWVDDSTAVGPLAFTAEINGKPTYTAASSSNG